MNAMTQDTIKVGNVEVTADLTRRPVLIDGCDTMVKLWAKRCAAYGKRTAHREKHLGIWRAHSWADWYEQSRNLGLALRKLGLGRGECVSILSEDNKEWLYFDLAIQAVGGIASGVYTTDSPAQLAYLVNDSKSRFLIVENDEMLDKYLDVADEMPGLVRVVCMDREGLHDFADERVIFMDDLARIGASVAKERPDLFEAEIARSQPDDIAILIYTSGTTGMPKGAMIDHGNLIWTAASSIRVFATNEDDEQVCFPTALPRPGA